MHFSLSPLVATILVLAGAAATASTDLQRSREKYNFELDRIELERATQHEEATKTYLRELQTRQAGYQRNGDLNRVIAAKEMVKQLVISGGEYDASAVPPDPELAGLHERQGQRLAAISDSAQTRRFALTKQYAAFLESETRRLTREGILEDALAYRQELSGIEQGEIMQASNAAETAAAAAPPAADVDVAEDNDPDDQQIIRARTLAAEFGESRLRAMRKYQGTRVRVTGMLDQTGRSGNGAYLLLDNSSVRVEFDANELPNKLTEEVRRVRNWTKEERRRRAFNEEGEFRDLSTRRDREHRREIFILCSAVFDRMIGRAPVMVEARDLELRVMAATWNPVLGFDEPAPAPMGEGGGFND